MMVCPFNLTEKEKLSCLFSLSRPIAWTTKIAYVVKFLEHYFLINKPKHVTARISEIIISTTKKGKRRI